jgi:hypothetical protein
MFTVKYNRNMSNTHKAKKHRRKFHHIAKFAAIHLGILLLLETNIAVTTASILNSGEGSLLAPITTATVRSPQAQSVIKAADQLHHAATEGLNAIITTQLVTGVLFVLFGFFLHAAWVVHKSPTGERPVHITVKKRKRKTPMWYWIEMRV